MTALLPALVNKETQLPLDVLQICREQHGDRPAFLGATRYQYTFSQLWDASSRLAAGLKDMGVGKGSVVFTVLGSDSEYPITMYAAWMLGSILVPIHERQGPNEVAAILNDVNPAVVLVSSKLKELAAPTAGLDVPVIMTDEEGSGPCFSDLLTSAPLDQVTVDPELPAVYQPTSGSTDIPKLAILPQKNLGQSMAQIADRMTTIMIPGEERIISMFPLGTVGGLLSLNSLMTGLAGAFVFCPNPMELLNYIKEYKASVVAAVPTVYARMTDHPLFAALAEDEMPKVLYSGGAPIPSAVTERYSKYFKVSVTQGYGMTEACGAISMTVPDGTPNNTVGRPVMWTEVKILDPATGEEVPTGEVGEIIARGPQVFAGYLNAPEETEQTLKDGWLYTGDLGLFDDKGQMIIKGRKRKMLITGGFNVYPSEVEDGIAGHPAVREVAVFGLPHEEWGEMISAAIILRDGMQATGDEIREFCSKNLSRYKVPQRVFFVDDFPRANTKVDLAALENMFKNK